MVDRRGMFMVICFCSRTSLAVETLPHETVLSHFKKGSGGVSHKVPTELALGLKEGGVCMVGVDVVSVLHVVKEGGMLPSWNLLPCEHGLLAPGFGGGPLGTVTARVLASLLCLLRMDLWEHEPFEEDVQQSPKTVPARAGLTPASEASKSS